MTVNLQKRRVAVIPPFTFQILFRRGFVFFDEIGQLPGDGCGQSSPFIFR